MEILRFSRRHGRSRKMGNVPCLCPISELPPLKPKDGLNGPPAFLTILELTRERYRFVVVGYAAPEQWRWSSYRFYLVEESGESGMAHDFVPGSGGVASQPQAFVVPALRKEREGTGHPLCWSIAARSKAWATPPVETLRFAQRRAASRRHRGILCSSRPPLVQLLSAIRAVRPSRLNGLMTFRARWLQQSAAVRTE